MKWKAKRVRPILNDKRHIPVAAIYTLLNRCLSLAGARHTPFSCLPKFFIFCLLCKATKFNNIFAGNCRCKVIVESNMTMETSKCRNHSCKKKIPKRINKAEREKMKRDNLNGLFLALATSLEVSDKNGKVSVLTEATRMVKDMVAQIERLKKENVALLSKSQYVMVEKNELRDENSCLEAEIRELQRDISSKVSELQLDLNISPLERCNQEARDDHMLPRLVQDGLCSKIQANSEVGMGHVSKPHARYPTPADQWPLKVLEPRPS